MEGPPLGPGGEDITWPDQVAPLGRKASSTSKIKPQTSNLNQESHRYSLGNRHIDLHAHNQLAEHMSDGEDPPLQDHMLTHFQHLPLIPHPREPPAWVPDDEIYHDTGRAYH